MERPTRLKRVPRKFLDDENVEDKDRKTKKVAEVENRGKASRRAGQYVLAKPQSAKGNFLAGEKTAVTRMPRLPVLQDRTNLPAEPFKADILVKQGTDDKAPSRTASLTRSKTKKPAVAKEAVESLAKKDEAAEDKAPSRTASLTRSKTKNAVIAKDVDESLAKTDEAAEDKAPSRTASLTRSKTKNAKEATKISDKREATNATTSEKNARITSSVRTRTKNAQSTEKTKKQKASRSPTSDNDNSLVVESENATDSEEKPKRASAKSSLKISKRRTTSKLTPSKRMEKNIETKRKTMRKSSLLVRKKPEEPSTSTQTTVKKFFKRKNAGGDNPDEKVLQSKKATTTSRKRIVPRNKPRVSTSFKLRQTTLGESFAKQAAKKNLRPRRTQKNYQDESTILEKSSNNKEPAVKGPIYKTAKISDESEREGSEVYEFHFDRNDSQERRAKKRKRRVVKNPTTKRKRVKIAKTTSKPKLTSNDAPEESNNNKVQKPGTTVPAKTTVASNNIPQIITSDFDAVSTTVQSTGETRIDITSTPQPAKSAEMKTKPQRTTNAFDIRPSVLYRNMQHHVLLNKSLSPISKALENFDPGSPWRPPAFTGQQFSRVRNIVQSTPQGRKFSAMQDKIRNSASLKPDLIQKDAIPRMNKIVENQEENIDKINEETKAIPRKVLGPAKSPRKFGTEISNVSLSINSASPLMDNNSSGNIESSRLAPSKTAEAAPSVMADSSENRIPVDNDPPGSYEEHADKENSEPIFTSPKKTLKSPRKPLARLSPLKSYNQRVTLKENVGPHPGPSGIQKRSPLGESRVLKQSNLNNFLSIPEVPTSTRLTSAHGIFADAHSTPIPGKPVKTIMEKEVKVENANLENAFGFDETEDSELDVSPIKGDLFKDPPAPWAVRKVLGLKQETQGNKAPAVPTRLSIGEIKQHVRPVEKEDCVQRILKNEKKPEEPEKEQKDKEKEMDTENAGDSTAFADTFDVISQTAKGNEENVQEVSLFADLEPVHFKQPPRRSYKRKRLVAFNVSEDEDEDAENSLELENPKTKKKKKMSKVERQRLKQMEDWAKDLNNTFEEIDHFDLVVE